jgi:nitrile hydratase accessory protein
LKLSDSRGLPKDADGPVFAEPWEAQAFAMAVKLNEAGVFQWSEWGDTLGAELTSAPERPYYESWLASLEKLVKAKGVVTEPERLARIEAWDRAAKATPHGQPILLSRD